jgi:hypothetical protein
MDVQLLGESSNSTSTIPPEVLPLDNPDGYYRDVARGPKCDKPLICIDEEGNFMKN